MNESDSNGTTILGCIRGKIKVGFLLTYGKYKKTRLKNYAMKKALILF